MAEMHVYGREEFFKSLLGTARKAVQFLGDHAPTLIGLDSNNTFMIWQFRSLKDKDAVAEKCRELVGENNLYIAAWIAEAWKATVKDKDLMERIDRHGVAATLDGDQRSEVIIFQIQDTLGEETYEVPIETKDGKRFLNVDAVERLAPNPEFQRWRMFPKMN